MVRYLGTEKRDRSVGDPQSTVAGSPDIYRDLKEALKHSWVVHLLERYQRVVDRWYDPLLNKSQVQLNQEELCGESVLFRPVCL